MTSAFGKNFGIFSQDLVRIGEGVLENRRYRFKKNLTVDLDIDAIIYRVKYDIKIQHQRTFRKRSSQQIEKLNKLEVEENLKKTNDHQESAPTYPKFSSTMESLIAHKFPFHLQVHM